MSKLLDLDARDDGLSAALESLAELANRRPELVRSFLGDTDDVSHLCRVDSVVGTAVSARGTTISFQPSQQLVEFLAAAQASEGDGAVVDVDLHGRSGGDGVGRENSILSASGAPSQTGGEA